MYEDKWWVACVLQVDEDNNTVTVNFLHPQGPSGSFRYPVTPDVLTIPAETILMKVDPRCTKRETYTLSGKESAGEKLRLKLKEM